jgi:hypothetical protein
VLVQAVNDCSSLQVNVWCLCELVCRGVHPYAVTASCHTLDFTGECVTWTFSPNNNGIPTRVEPGEPHKL